MYSRGYKIKKMQLITRIVCTSHKSKLPFAGEFNSSYLTVVLKESICWIAFILFTVKKCKFMAYSVLIVYYCCSLSVVVCLSEVEDGGDAAAHVLDRGPVLEESGGRLVSVSANSHVYLRVCILS